VHDYIQTKMPNLFARCQFTGIDLSPAAIAFAKDHLGERIIEFLEGDLFDYKASKNIDYILCNLCIHHLKDEDIPEFLTWMEENAARGWIINDLHRHSLAYYSIRLLTTLFSKSRLVRYDSGISVLRAFKYSDWVGFLGEAKIVGARISWHWAFRYVVSKETNGK
jgi:SAM-dependent methyltransferase